uniref:Uncharacterized protein n=1 Tax=Streptomyces sp. NBC_00049 TaxID=2903617 RepID=A0AAU2K0G2_9ACTN
MPLIDADRARRALAALAETSRACQSTVTASAQRYIGDFAREVSEHLPGQWTVQVENYGLSVWQDDLAAGLWATGPILRHLQHNRVPSAAILQSEAGTELAIVHDPFSRVYHVGMLAPKDMYLDESVTPPPSISVHPAAVPAARKIISSLLPSYHRAVFETQLNHLADDLAWAQEEFEPGAVQDPPQQDLAKAFDRFTAIAPHIIASLRTNDALAFDARERAVLEHMDAAFGQPGPGREDAGTARENPSLDLLAMWMTEGEGLVELARSAARAGTTQTALGLVRAVEVPRALPSSPTQVGAGPSRR